MRGLGKRSLIVLKFFNDGKMVGMMVRAIKKNYVSFIRERDAEVRMR